MLNRSTEDKVQYTLTQKLVGDVDGWPIYQAAFNAIIHARTEGQSSGKHPPDSWMEETILTQLEHSNEHGYNAYTDIVENNCTPRLEEMEHALCRLAIAIALYKKEQENVLPN